MGEGCWERLIEECRRGVYDNIEELTLDEDKLGEYELSCWSPTICHS